MFASVASCSITTASARSTEALELSRNRQRWASAGIHDYEFEVQRLCFCPDEATERVRVVVRQDAITSVVRTRDGALASTRVTSWPRVDDLFAEIQQRLDQHVERVEVQYDPTYGYPRSIVVDIAVMAADDEYSVTASNLRRL